MLWELEILELVRLPELLDWLTLSSAMLLFSTSIMQVSRSYHHKTRIDYVKGTEALTVASFFFISLIGESVSWVALVPKFLFFSGKFL